MSRRTKCDRISIDVCKFDGGLLLHMLELQPMIHKFKMKDKYFCLDVNSGIIHVIDELPDRVLDI